MAGLGKFMKQAQKMQRQVEETQAALAARELEVSSGGGAVVIRINGHGEFLSLKLNPEFLKEDVALVEETLLAATRDAAAKAKALNEEEMRKATAGFQLPGMM
jgi:DNA-binding YbaB/EbfC family protein